MSTPFDHYPYTNFHELNLAYFIVHFREIFAQWDQLYSDMLDWKNATDEELAEWKAGVLSDIDAWETALNNSLDAWKAETESDISGWMNDVIDALDAWKAAFQTLFDTTFSNLEDIKTDAEAARDAAIAAQTAAETAASSVSASAAQIATNTSNITALQTTSGQTTAILNYMSDDNLSLTWEQGTINSTGGGKDSSTRRVRTPDFITLTDCAYIKLNSNLMYAIASYTSTGTFIGISTYATAVDTTQISKPANAAKYYIVLRNIDNTDLAPSDISAGDVILYSYTAKINMAECVDTITDMIDTQDNVTVTWEQGTYSSDDGSAATSVSRVRSSEAFPIDHLHISVPATYQISMMGYKDTSLTGYLGATGFVDGGDFDIGNIPPPVGAFFVRFVLRWKTTPTAAIAPSDISGVSLYKYYDLDDRFEQCEKYGMPRSCSPSIEFICKDGMVSTELPPNSTYAIKAAFDNEYDRIRFSVTKTTDGAYVAVHDVTINDLAVNTDGSPISTTIYTADCSLADLNTYDWGLKFGAQYKGLKVPMLDDCLAVATQFNLSVALDFKWTVDSTDIANIVALLAKYGQTNAYLFALSYANMQAFIAACPHLSVMFTGETSSFNNWSDRLKQLLNGYNKVLWEFRPLGAIPDTEAITAAAPTGIDLIYGPIEGFSALTTLGVAHGIKIMECRYIDHIKTAMAEYYSALIE